MKKKILESILANFKIDELNEMQQASIVANEKHDDVILLSATGSGKTLAFLLPVLDLLDEQNKQTQALIIVPSRELAMQIEKVFKQMTTAFKITCCYGGHKREVEENNLKQPPALLVGTPGRLADHIRRKNITTDAIQTLVLDEFDKSLELGFSEDMSFIISELPNIRKRILTSATEAVEVPDFIGLTAPEKLNFITENISTEKLLIQKIESEAGDKMETLFELLCSLGDRNAIVFCNHREAVERTSKWLAQKGIDNEFYHGAMEQHERDAALCKFRNGSTHFLVTTDLAARGLDIPNIRYIIHYHLPINEASFIHRNGRTARMDASGTVIMILSKEEKITDYISTEVEKIELSSNLQLPEKPMCTTLYIAAGKKDNVNKIDVVGFLSNKGQLKKDDIGLIEVKDFSSFVAIRKTKLGEALRLIKNEKIKNKKVMIAVAK